VERVGNSALPKVNLQWNVADLFPGLVPDHDAQMVLGGFASRQVFCNQIGVVHRSSIVSEVFRDILWSNGDALFKGEGVVGHRGSIGYPSGRCRFDSRHKLPPTLLGCADEVIE